MTSTMYRPDSDNLYPTSSLILYQRGVHYTGIKMYNKLPPDLKELVQLPKLLSVLYGDIWSLTVFIIIIIY
jgi:hypothetical protein